MARELNWEASKVANEGLQFSQHLLRHDRALLRYIMTFIPRRDDAEEVLQCTATALWEKFSEFDSEREFLPWALRFAYFEVLNFRKEAARSRLVFSQEVVESLADSHSSMDFTLERQRMALKECLRRVDADGKRLLHRRYCDSESLVPLAQETGKTVKSLYRRLDRVREMIARCVERRLNAEVE